MDWSSVFGASVRALRTDPTPVARRLAEEGVLDPDVGELLDYMWWDRSGHLHASMACPNLADSAPVTVSLLEGTYANQVAVWCDCGGLAGTRVGVELLLAAAAYRAIDADAACETTTLWSQCLEWLTVSDATNRFWEASANVASPKLQALYAAGRGAAWSVASRSLAALDPFELELALAAQVFEVPVTAMTAGDLMAWARAKRVSDAAWGRTIASSELPFELSLTRRLLSERTVPLRHLLFVRADGARPILGPNNDELYLLALRTGVLLATGRVFAVELLPSVAAGVAAARGFDAGRYLTALLGPVAPDVLETAAVLFADAQPDSPVGTVTSALAAALRL